MADNVRIEAETNLRKKEAVKTRIINSVPLIGLAVVAGLYFVSIAVTGYNLRIQMEVIINNMILVGFVATGATFIFSIGSFDLSLGANMLLCAIVSSLVYNKTHSFALMLLVCLGLALLISLVNYLLATVFNLPVFIMTVAMMTVLSTIASFILGKDTIYLQYGIPADPNFKLYRTVLSTAGFRFVILGAYVLACAFVFYYTRIGRQQKFFGGNPVCAKLTGLSSIKLSFISFSMAAVGIALAAFCATLPTASVTTSTGSSVGMNMLIAIVFGGMSLSGGPKTKALAAFIGGCTMAFLDQLMFNILQATGVGGSADYITMIVKAVLFLTVVFFLSIATRPKRLPR